MGRGSMRRRGEDAWELRVYLGTDAKSGRQRWAGRTIHGSQPFARSQLRDLVEEAGYARLRAGTLADLLDQWFDAGSLGWALTTVSHTGSVIDCYLKPHLGHLQVVQREPLAGQNLLRLCQARRVATDGHECPRERLSEGLSDDWVQAFRT